MVRRAFKSVSPGKVETGLSKAMEYRGAPYATWKPGMDHLGAPLYTDGLPAPGYMRKHGAICSTVPVIFRLANGLAIPGIQGVLKGGTLYWHRLYGEHAIEHGKHYPAGTLFGSPYLGPELERQGHVAVAAEAGANPLLIQSVHGSGLHDRWRLNDVDRFTYAAEPGAWL